MKEYSLSLMCISSFNLKTIYFDNGKFKYLRMMTSVINLFISSYFADKETEVHKNYVTCHKVAFTEKARLDAT